MSNWRSKNMFDVDGEISQIWPNESAEIQFNLNGKMEKAFLKKGRFYHCGKLIPDNVPFANYIREKMQVTFSCHILEQQEGSVPKPFHTAQCNWYVTMCRAKNKSPLEEVTINGGIFAAVGVISKITKRHGILSMTDREGDEHRVAFLASKVYIHGKRFSSSKMLNTQLCLDEKLVFDGVPCIPEVDADNCRWFATCAFQGKRPRLANPIDTIPIEFQANYLEAKPHVDDGVNKDGTTGEIVNQLLQSSDSFKTQLLKIIKLHTNNPRTLFTTGYGFILDILNDEFGLILGCFKKNVYQTVLFHRKNAFLFKVPLARAKLSDIFVEGDRVKFIAVGTPPDFYADWIAVQVSVSTSVYTAEDTVAM